MQQKCEHGDLCFIYTSWSFQSNLAHTPLAAEAAAAAAKYGVPDMLPLQRKLLFVPHIIDVNLRQHRMSASASSSSKVHACHATLPTPSALSWSRRLPSR
jgi:hypothetical protein